jgi:hypothetical protein
MDNDALAEMKKKQNYESLRITDLQRLIKGMDNEIGKKVSGAWRLGQAAGSVLGWGRPMPWQVM